MKYVAILGLGTVGGGTAEILEKNAAVIRLRAGEELSLRYILVRRDRPGHPYREKFVTDFSVIEKDPAVSVVAECIGGTGAALDYDRRALRAGKSVVTSNKELVAAHGLELARLAREHGVSFLFEGSVGGGIPVLHTLSLCLAGNRIGEALGILNGTTNYILTAMEQGRDYAGALAEAQRLGYAEQDPAADVEGLDAGRKICILADLCFGQNVDPARVSMEGITGVTPEDIACAEALGCRIKLLGRALRLPGGRAAVYAAPHLVPAENLLAGIRGVTNGIFLRGDAVGETFLCGPGAGRLPTGSAVVGDIIDAAQCAGHPRVPEWSEAPDGYLADPEELPCRWYVRGGGREAARELFPTAEFAGAAEGAFLTPPMTGRELRARAAPLRPRSIFRALAPAAEYTGVSD